MPNYGRNLCCGMQILFKKKPFSFSFHFLIIIFAYLYKSTDVLLMLRDNKSIEDSMFLWLQNYWKGLEQWKGKYFFFKSLWLLSLCSYWWWWEKEVWSISDKCYFIGYDDTVFGYRLWDDQNQKIIRSISKFHSRENYARKNPSYWVTLVN